MHLLRASRFLFLVSSCGFLSLYSTVALRLGSTLKNSKLVSTVQGFILNRLPMVKRQAAIPKSKDVWNGSADWETQTISSFTSWGDAIGTRTWLPLDSANIVGVIIISHGLHEHCGRYAPVARILTSRMYGVYSLDYPGHGMSEGAEMGFVEDYTRMVDALVELMKMTLEANTSVPVYLLSHSMGTLVGISALAKLQTESPDLYLRIKSAVWSGCPFQPGPGSASPLGLKCLFCLTKSKRLLNFLAKTFASLDPHGPNAPIDRDALTHSIEAIAAIENDYYNFDGKIKNKTGYEVIKMLAHCRAVASSITTPSLILHGSEDEICYPAGSREFVALLGSTRKDLRILPGMFHEVLNEVGYEKLVDDIITFYESDGNEHGTGLANLQNISLESSSNLGAV